MFMQSKLAFRTVAVEQVTVQPHETAVFTMRIESSEDLRSETTFEKARLARWMSKSNAVPVETRRGCELFRALDRRNVPDLATGGVTQFTPLRLGSLVVMRSGKRWYLGKVLAFYSYTSTTRKHESLCEATSTDKLSYISLQVFLPQGFLNLFAHSDNSLAEDFPLALYTHAPIAEFVYNLHSARLTMKQEGLYSLNGEDTGLPRWRILTSEPADKAVSKADNTVDDDDSSDEEEEEAAANQSKRKGRFMHPRI